MKKLLSIILICLNLCCILTGCKDFKDIDKRLFVVAIGIDSIPNNKKEIEVTFKTAVTKTVSNSDGGGTSGNSVIYSIKGNSIVDIFREIKTQTFTEPDFSHMKLIVFGGEFLKNNTLNELIEFFIRRRDFQNTSYVAVALPSAKEVLSHELQQENFSGNGLFLKFGEGAENPYGLTRRLYEIYHQTMTPGISASLPIIELKEDKFLVEKICILYDGKIKLELSRDESKIFNMLSRNVTLASLSIQEENNKIGIGLNQITGKIKYDKRSEELKFNVELKATVTLEETGQILRTRQELSDKFSSLLCKRVGVLLEKLRDNNVDPFELEIKYWAYNKDFWFNKNWLEEELPRVKFNVSCDLKMVSTGTLK